MNAYLLGASLLCALMSCVHSYLGERHIFRKLFGSATEQQADPALPREAYMRVLWATWHVVSVWGMAFGGILLVLACSVPSYVERFAILMIVMVAAVIAASMVYFSTGGKHASWLGLLIVACLIVAGLYW